MPEIFFTKSERETEELAFKIAKDNKIKFGDIVALRGDLGVGKTAFTRGFVRFFSPSLRVTSPTFSLVNEYKTDGVVICGAPGSSRPTSKKILHFDMYRLNSHDDLLSVGFYDYLDGESLIIIEWFEKIADFFDENTINIDIVKLSCEADAPRSGERKIIYADTRH